LNETNFPSHSSGAENPPDCNAARLPSMQFDSCVVIAVLDAEKTAAKIAEAAATLLTSRLVGL
jgi:hypothetical protein